MDKVFKAIAAPFDLITYPFYYPFAKKQTNGKIRLRGKQEDPNDPYSPWMKVMDERESVVDGCQTVDDLTRKMIITYGEKRAMGIRRIQEKEKQIAKDGKTMIKKQLEPEFTWYSYNKVDKRIDSIMRGLEAHGVKQKDFVVIFMETRMEWMLAAQAVYRMGAVVATIYATLGDEGVTFGINEVEASHVVTSNDLLPKVKKIASKLTSLKSVIYVCDEVSGQFEKASVPSIDGVEMIAFHDLESEGSKNTTPSEPRDIKPTDSAVLMYTSGSTGNPKGVLLDQTNTLAAIKNMGFMLTEYGLPDDSVSIAYLPLAHIMELMAEPIFLANGIGVGYSSPLTLVTGSPGLKKGCLGDVEILKPDILAGVPLILDRLRKTVEDKVRSKGYLVNEFFKFALDYKQDWDQSGFNTPLLDKMIFNKRKLFGGRLKVILSGGAPLSRETAVFTRNVLGVEVMQGYASTESGGAGCCYGKNDSDLIGTCGAPIPGTRLKLIDWEEGGYRPTDKPNPRGEIVIGGKSVSTQGYFKNEEMSHEVFSIEDGIRWVKMGDIGEVLADGTVRIIDRKKDLVKLQMGEYVSLGKVESELKNCPIVMNICTHADSFHNFIVAFIIPNRSALESMAKKLKKEHKDFDDMCSDPEIVEMALKEITDHAKQSNLNKTEIPGKIKLCTESWTPDSGMVTAAMKIRRKQITDFYAEDIKRMYSQ